MAVTQVIGLGFGDEGKGTVVDYLSRREAVAVVRFGGGPQATHHVVLPDGRWHGFSQLGAGTFVPGALTHLARDVLVEPVSLLREDEVLREKGLRDALARLTIDPRAALVLPYHKMTGQLAELARGGERHGTVGLGVGEAARERDAGQALTLAHARAPELRGILAERIAARLAHAEELARTAASPEADERLGYFRRELDADRLARILANFATAYAARLVPDDQRLPALAATHALVLEGAQGVLLDPRTGFPPFITKTPATPSAALEALVGRGTRLGVLRAYAHRHGPGPLPTEDAALALPERHNAWNRWQGAFRTGPLDLVLARYAVAASRVDALAVTCLDRLAGTGDVRIVTSYAAPAREPWFDEAFVMDDAGDRIVGLRGAHLDDVARVLSACRPAGELRLPGWEAIAGTELPRTARAFLDFLASGDGLATPIALVSTGPTYLQKLRVA